MKKIRNFFSIVTIIILLTFLVFNEQILDYINTNYIHFKSQNIYLEYNEYAKKEDYKFVKNTKNFMAKNYQDLLVTMRFTDWIMLYNSYYSDRKLTEKIIDIEKLEDKNEL